MDVDSTHQQGREEPRPVSALHTDVESKASRNKPVQDEYLGDHVCFACNGPLPDDPPRVGWKAAVKMVNGICKAPVLVFADGAQPRAITGDLFPCFCCTRCRDKVNWGKR